MLPSFVLALREGLEAALVVGIVISVLRKMEQKHLYKTIWFGTVCAILVSILAALGLNWIGAEFSGKGEQLFEGTTMLLAAGILTWMIFWMRKQSIMLKHNIESRVNRALEGQGKSALFLLAFLAVVREGIELALFLLAARLTSDPLQELLGAGLGLTAAAILGWVIFTTSTKISLTQFFKLTNILLAFFAAGLVGLGIHEFTELGWIPLIIDHVWNLGDFIPDGSILGQLLKALLGYDSSPALSQVIAYFGYFVILLAISITIRKLPSSNRSSLVE